MKDGTYIVLFRGVGGKTQLPTNLLREKLDEAAFENVVTYINSGNAVLRSTLSRKATLAAIAALCREEFAFEKAIFILTLKEWERVIANNPFSKEADCAPTTVHAALLEKAPTSENVERVRSCAADGEDLRIVGGVAYLHTPHGFGRCKMAEKFDAWIGVTNTARNWNTVLKLAELGRKCSA